MASKGATYFNIVSKFDNTGVKQAEGAFGGLGTSLSKLGGIIAAAFSVRAITNFAKESITAAEGVQVANNRLDQIAKSMGLFGEQTAEVTSRLKDYAEANEITLATDAEVIKGIQGKLLVFKDLAGTAGQAGGAFDRATRAAIDLAAAGFGSAEGNAVKLGRALQDPIKGMSALTRSGVVFTQAEKERIKVLVESGKTMEAQNLILSAIEQRVGGTAAATATASAKMQLAFDNIRESVGGALMPAFAALTEAMLPIIEELAPMLGEAISKATPAFVDLAKAFPSLLEAVTPLIPVFIGILEALAELATSVIPIFVEILETLLPIIEDLVPVFIDLFEQAIRPLIPAILDLVKQFAPFIEQILPVLLTLISELIPPLLTVLEELFIPLIPIVIELIEAFLPLIEQVLPILADFLTVVLIPILMTVVDILKNVLVGAIGFFSDSITNFSNFMKTFSETFGAIWQGISDTVRTVIRGILGFIQGLVNGVIDGVNAVIRAINSIRVTIPDWVPGFGGATFGLNLPRLSRVQIPQLAEGGIVMPQQGGVLANLAEGGVPEAVIPLDRVGSFGSKNTYNITVNAGMGTDGRSVGRQIVEEILRYEKSSGKVFARA